MFEWLRQLGGKTAKLQAAEKQLAAVRARELRARYDAARTTHENRRHWANADLLSADAAASPDVRRILRSRARYEVANNSYAKGIVQTKANYVIGTGPRLQMLIEKDADANRFVEREFGRWARAIGLSDKLRRMRIAQCESGESFGLLTNNPQVNAMVQLDLRLIEADQVATPWPVGLVNDCTVDGIAFDKHGNPTSYYVLHEHPGADGAWKHDVSAFDSIPANNVIHLFRADRPGQSRGIPEITSSLPLFAMLRRYTLAVLSAAEQAALTGGVIYTDGPGEYEDGQSNVEPMETVDMDRGTWLTMPSGYKIAQIKAEQPTTVYGDFKRELINEIARCLDMPYNIAAGNSSGYNYASGRLDHQAFFKATSIDQNHIVNIVLDRVFSAWLNEAVLIEGYLPAAARTRDALYAHKWFWDGLEHVDPAKEAKAQETRLNNNTTTLAKEYARAGLDWENELIQLARERKLMRKLGLLSEADLLSVATEDDDGEENDEDEK